MLFFTEQVCHHVGNKMLLERQILEAALLYHCRDGHLHKHEVASAHRQVPSDGADLCLLLFTQQAYPCTSAAQTLPSLFFVCV